MIKLTYTPIDFPLSQLPDADHHFVLYNQPEEARLGSVGTGIKEHLSRAKLIPAAVAWDLLSIALSVIAADFTISRSDCPDGWTRQFHLIIAVKEPDLWNRLKPELQRMLRFLTTDIWHLTFVGNGDSFARPKKHTMPLEDSVVLLSGGMDSLVGAIDLVAQNNNPLAVSQIVRGEHTSQVLFAKELGGLQHIALNHNARLAYHTETSSRARSLIFITYGILIATTLKSYAEGNRVDLYICENGFISLNPPLTPARLGSLSTRTTHPIYMGYVQDILNKLNINVRIRNPYQFATKGEMLTKCSNQTILAKLAHDSISCGKYKRHGFQHCGRCVPCMIRRAAFKYWGKRDKTSYKFANLGLNDKNHARFDDVRSAAIAIAQAKAEGAVSFIDNGLLQHDEKTLANYVSTLERGFAELEQLLLSYKKRW